MDDPLDPFARGRAAGCPVAGRVRDDEFVMVLRYEQLKAVARDWARFTSDAPFQVPIPSEHDVRSVRQLPIETDPPLHAEYREIVAAPFSRTTAAAIEPQVTQIVDALLDGALARGSVEVVRSFALPVQSHALALMLGRSAEEAQEWTSWGTHVFRDVETSGDGHASDLDRYLERVLDAAQQDPGDDFFGLLAKATVDGRPLSREEMLGFANLTFAGGRDTVINLITNTLEYLARNPGACARLRGDAGLVKSATEEFLRYFSPLTHIGRVVVSDTQLFDQPVEAGSVISLCFASANRDEAVFDRPEECDISRRPNRHVAFGHGPHTCLGAPLARMVLAVTLQRFVDKVGTAEVREAVPKTEDLGAFQRQVSFERLVLGLNRR